MTLVLLAVGFLATAAGFVAIGFGIPINAFSLGNTLIISGTITVAAGLILIALALAIGQLKRIAEALKVRGGRPAETVESMVPPTARMSPAASADPFASARSAPQPPAPEVHAPEPALTELYAPRASEPPQPEPRFPVTPSEPSRPAHSMSSGPLDWLRAKPKSQASASSMPTPAMPTPAMPMPSVPMPSMSTSAMPPMVEPPMVPDEAPLSPRPPSRPAMPPMAEPALEPKIWSPDRAGGSSAPRAEQPMPRATPQPEPPKEKFDLVWPDRGSAVSAPAPNEPGRQPALEMPLPPVPARPRDNKRGDISATKPAAERGPAILKSGVIDGMPYTLYADGSIEAELPKGTVKFASVDALRSHLEKNA